MNYEYRINVRDDDVLRASFNQLTKQVFAFDFEDWYRRGYWGTKYIPHVLIDNGEVIANVSANEIDFIIDGQKKRLIQLGTVMTNDAYRKQGLGRYIMEQILEKYKGKADGIYLFGNDSVLEYYPKFGFQKYEQYQYYISMDGTGDRSQNSVGRELLRQVDMSDKKDCEQVLHTIENNISDDQVLMVDNLGLYMFYLAGGPMGDMVYEVAMEAGNVYAVLEQEANQLMIHQIFADCEIDRRYVIDLICQEYVGKVTEIKLGFTPHKTEGLLKRKLYVEDSTFWGMGDDMKRFGEEGMMFPTLSHA
ncbi:MAG TPA: GNAT family N-acetyltransferase [Lachnospiraceae bacterium]|nr:GNAT family N-acetyltransferase [Lachnospiraceae bacterium]